MPEHGLWVLVPVLAFSVIAAYVSAQAANRKGWPWGASFVTALFLGPILGPLAALVIRDKDADAW